MCSYKILIIIGFLSLLLGYPFLANAYCGDKVIEESQTEECDDGNFNNGDGCNSYCKLEDQTPPEVTSVSVAEGENNVPTTLKEIQIFFSEPIDILSVNQNSITLEHQAKPLDIDLKLDDTLHIVTIALKQVLFSEDSHAIHIKNIRDLSGNVAEAEFTRVFNTAVHIDTIPPTVIATPPAGTYNYSQAITLTAYLDPYHSTFDFIDNGATIYYTLDGSEPTIKSSQYTGNFYIKDHSTLRYFAVDQVGNRSVAKSAVYTFECAKRPNSERVSPYPLCRVLTCEKGFVLRNNSCVTDVKSSDINYKDDSVTAPLFSSSVPMVISSKPAIYITAQHRGLISRPIIFKNIKRGTEVQFDQNTYISDASGKAFAGYITPPINRYSKEFPINFGYSFKSILEFKPTDGRRLTFDRPYRIIVPFSDRFTEGAEVVVFTFNPDTEQYKKYDSTKVLYDSEKKEVVILASTTGVFFVAQPGEGFSEAVFTDMESHWAKNYAEALQRRGIVKGRSKGVYAPDDVLNRAEFTKIAIEAIGETVLSTDELEDTYFPDVPLYAWYAPYVNKAYELGLIKGYSDGTFRPEQPIKRVEAVKIMVSAFGFDVDDANGFKSEENFEDIFTQEWYYPAVNYVVKHGLLSGRRNRGGKILPAFGPGKDMTRGEMAELGIKAIELKETLSK